MTQLSSKPLSLFDQFYILHYFTYCQVISVHSWTQSQNLFPNAQRNKAGIFHEVGIVKMGNFSKRSMYT